MIFVELVLLENATINGRIWEKGEELTVEAETAYQLIDDGLAKPVPVSIVVEPIVTDIGCRNL